MPQMQRRHFITMLSGMAVAWPLTAPAQQAAMPVVGFLSSLSQFESSNLVAAFRRGLSETGFIEGQNIAVDYRWADGRYERLPAMAADLISRRVALLVSTGGHPPLLAAKAAATTVPIVFSTGVDPVKTGIIASFSRPGANLTGVHVLTTGLEAKRFGLLQELAPTSAAIAVLANPSNPNTQTQLNDVHDAARAVARPLHVLHASAERDLETAFATIGRLKPGALLIASDPWLSTRRSQLIELSARYAIPTMYQWRESADAGGLMSYGTNLADAYRHVGVYAGRVLKGANPSDLPVLQPTKFELVINLKTARSLGVQIPPGVLAIADEVIE
jgi:putative tryptophan/tyrosine transport system substrate-binding protein